jgi:AcrR family transcriptional regulator
VNSTVTTRGDKRPRLVTAATAVFAEKGYASTRVADIAERAGVGKGTVYEYFSSKEELLFAVFESINEEISIRVGAALSKNGSAREKLLALLQLGAKVISEQVELQPVILDFWAASRGKDFEEHYREAVIASYGLFRSMISDFIRGGQKRGEFKAGIDAEALATAVIATVDGLGIQLFFDPSIDPHKVVETFAHMLYEVLTTESP